MKKAIVLCTALLLTDVTVAQSGVAQIQRPNILLMMSEGHECSRGCLWRSGGGYAHS